MKDNFTLSSQADKSRSIEISAVTTHEWRELIAKANGHIDVKWLWNESVILLEESIALHKSGYTSEVFKKDLQAITMIMYADIHAKYLPGNDKHAENTNNLKYTLFKKGLKQSVLDESLVSLSVAVPVVEMPVLQKTKKAKYRKASAVEIMSIRQAVKKSLKDPISPIFGGINDNLRKLFLRRG